MPMMRRIGSPRRLSRSARTSGIPPATAASKSRSTPCRSAAWNSSTPTLASSSLLAVTTGLPAASAVVISSRAGSMPPMTSTTRSTSGSATTSWASRVSTPGAARRRGRGEVAHGDPGDLEAHAGAGLDLLGLLGDQPTRAAPTLPHKTPTRTCVNAARRPGLSGRCRNRSTAPTHRAEPAPADPRTAPRGRTRCGSMSSSRSTWRSSAGLGSPRVRCRRRVVARSSGWLVSATRQHRTVPADDHDGTTPQERRIVLEGHPVQPRPGRDPAELRRIDGHRPQRTRVGAPLRAARPSPARRGDRAARGEVAQRRHLTSGASGQGRRTTFGA